MYNKEQRRVYTNSYRSRRKEYAKSLLGEACVLCGEHEELEFDHIEPSTKVAEISDLLTASKEVFEKELLKCQLLCIKCHKQKTSNEPRRPSWNKGKWSHGTITGYNIKGCRCTPCKEAKSIYRKRFCKKTT